MDIMCAVCMPGIIIVRKRCTQMKCANIKFVLRVSFLVLGKTELVALFIIALVRGGVCVCVWGGGGALAI